jgi:hypothetical protein
MKNLTAHQITTALGRIDRGLSQYFWLQERVRSCDVRQNQEFQTRFVVFYRVRRNALWKTNYFALLERAKVTGIDFSAALAELMRLTGNIEASFASKLVASLDPSTPVMDKFVLEYFGLRLPNWGSPDREAKVVGVYRELCGRYGQLMQSPMGTMIGELFDRKYPGRAISELKKVDLVLWQTRS